MQNIKDQMMELFRQYRSSIYQYWYREFAYETVMFYQENGMSYQQIKETVTVEMIVAHLSDDNFYKDVYAEMIAVATNCESTWSGGFNIQNMCDQEKRRVALVFAGKNNLKHDTARHVHLAMLKYLEE